jgi:hypothetical protein
MSIKDLERALNKADSDESTIKAIVSDERYGMKCDAERRIQLFLDTKYGKRLRELREVASAAQQRLTEEKERVALSGKNAPFPIGSKVVSIRSGRYASDPKTSLYGIVEAVTRETILPDNQGRWNHPNIGSFVVRLLKADGTPSKKVEEIGSEWAISRWKLVGQTAEVSK